MRLTVVPGCGSPQNRTCDAPSDTRIMGERSTRWKDRYGRFDARIRSRASGWSVRRRWLVFVLAPLLVFCCCGGVVGVPLLWVIRQTLQAGRGLPSPDAAADAYLLALSYDQEDGLLPLLDEDHRDELVAQWRAYRDAMKATDPPPFKLDYGSLAVGPIRGGRAEVRVDVRATWWDTDDNGRVGGWTGTAHTWVIEAHDVDGWRVSRVDAPAWCGVYVLRCGQSAEPSAGASSGSPDPSPSDLLQHPREMLPCGPRDPFPQLHSCPPSSGAATSPSGPVSSGP